MTHLRFRQSPSHSKVALIGLLLAIPVACGSEDDKTGSVVASNTTSGNGSQSTVDNNPTSTPSNTTTGSATTTSGTTTTPPSQTGTASTGSSTTSGGPTGTGAPPDDSGATADGPAVDSGPTGDSGPNGGPDAMDPAPTGDTGPTGSGGRGNDPDNTNGSPSGGTMGTGATSGVDEEMGGGSNTPVEPGGSDDPLPSAGCGATPPDSMRYSIDVGGTSREYILKLPDDYDPNKAYRLVFAWHPWGGSAQQVAGNGNNGYYGLVSASNGEAILVSPEGLDFGGNGLGWGNENGQDIEFLQAMLERFDAELCFDHNRTFSTGFSFGGMMSNAVACAGLARAVAPMAGNSSVAGCEGGSTSVAYMGFHGVNDSVVSIEGGRSARDEFVERNGCGAEIASDSTWCDGAGDNYQPCECKTFDGCKDGYPVTWCEYNGDHMVAPNSGETIWNFFAQF
jgi:polyhydroxybutyrate depolymerase